VVLPSFLASSQARFERAASELFAEPLRLAVVDEFRWLCEQRRALAQTRTPIPATVQARYARAQRAFAAPRFSDAYDRWVADGEASFHILLSPLLRDASQRGDVRVITQIQPHSYLNLARSVITA
jgi:hypothetical protein